MVRSIRRRILIKATSDKEKCPEMDIRVGSPVKIGGTRREWLLLTSLFNSTINFTGCFVCETLSFSLSFTWSVLNRSLWECVRRLLNVKSATVVSCEVPLLSIQTPVCSERPVFFPAVALGLLDSKVGMPTRKSDFRLATGGKISPACEKSLKVRGSVRAMFLLITTVSSCRRKLFGSWPVL